MKHFYDTNFVRHNMFVRGKTSYVGNVGVDDDRLVQGDHVQAGHEDLPMQFQHGYLDLDGQCGHIATTDRTCR